MKTTPLLILAIIPFGAVGAIWGHAVMGLPITMFTIFGFVALTGVIVNDAIVLIDFINKRLADKIRHADNRRADSTVPVLLDGHYRSLIAFLDQQYLFFSQSDGVGFLQGRID